MFNKRMNIQDIIELKEEQVIKLFSDMRNGKIRKKNGCKYKSVQDYVKVFKAFWHWYMKHTKKQSKKILTR